MTCVSDGSGSECVHSWAAHTGDVHATAFSPDMSAVYSMGADGKVCAHRLYSPPSQIITLLLFYLAHLCILHDGLMHHFYLSVWTGPKVWTWAKNGRKLFIFMFVYYTCRRGTDSCNSCISCKMTISSCILRALKIVLYLMKTSCNSCIFRQNREKSPFKSPVSKMPCHACTCTLKNDVQVFAWSHDPGPYMYNTQ